MNAETLYKDFVRYITEDLFPPLSRAAFFGLGGEDLHRVQPVLGVWSGLERYGLLEKDAFKSAIRQDKVGEFFEQGRLKLAAKGHGYALKVQEMNVFFEGLPLMGPDPPQNLVLDTELAFITAIDTYTMPHFQTPQTQCDAWDKAELLLGQLMQQSELPGMLRVLKRALGLYREAREFYKMRRRTPAGLKELIQTLGASGAQEEQDSSDEASSDDA